MSSYSRYDTRWCLPPMLFNLYVCHLPSQLNSCSLVSYADDSTLLKIILIKESRLCAAAEINDDLCRVAC